MPHTMPAVQQDALNTHVVHPADNKEDHIHYTTGDPIATGSNSGSRSASRSRNESPSNSRPGSRSQSRVREILHKATHMSSGQDWAAQGFAPDTLPKDSATTVPTEGVKSDSPSNSRSGSRSQSRVREILHKATHMSSGQDWAAQGFQSPESRSRDASRNRAAGGEVETERRGRHETPVDAVKNESTAATTGATSTDRSRSGSRIRDAIKSVFASNPDEPRGAAGMGSTSTQAPVAATSIGGTTVPSQHIQPQSHVL